MQTLHGGARFRARREIVAAPGIARKLSLHLNIRDLNRRWLAGTLMNQVP
ncbi:MAG TPA: hypothetical protein VFS47_10925 [Steroidobacteraceae bacterium]|nr:hypothetical protein [Steroidobacteraceae bacterium]